MVQLKNLSDKELVMAYVSQHSTGAFNILLTRYAEFIKGLIASKVFDTDEQADLFQEISVRLYANLKEKYREEGRFHSWLCCLVSNHLISYFRKKQKEPDMIVANFDWMKVTYVRNGDCLENERVLSVLEDVLGTMGEDMQEAFRMKFYEGLTYRQIAERKNIPLSTLNKRFWRALQYLRREMQAKGITAASYHY